MWYITLRRMSSASYCKKSLAFGSLRYIQSIVMTSKTFCRLLSSFNRVSLHSFIKCGASLYSFHMAARNWRVEVGSSLPALRAMGQIARCVDFK